MATFVHATGDLTEDDADILVCTCNVTGPNGRPAMGAGVALAFKKRWPSIKASYEADCLSGALREGGCRLYELPEDTDLFSARGPRRLWAALCTKRNWQQPSRYEWVESGLRELAALTREGGFRSLALPPPGCGKGKLDWEKVRPMILAAFADVDVEVRLYAPAPAYLSAPAQPPRRAGPSLGPGGSPWRRR
jgi:O-acetyl-ADP-ribose deacetylase (regulator of RNase III)